ncbi:HNH endonuclease [Salmonella phage ST3]|uniref:HNH endonuclease n=1 Tax=Salmonella phage ST3 TaxID=2025820 RepID=A0A5Q2F9R3_9CAUD|nr:HNH endonuclease [Salmonella phage ST-3]
MNTFDCSIHGLVKGHSNGKKYPLRCSVCNTERVIKNAKATKMQVIAYKGGKCKICSYDRCPAALELHHVDPSQKDFSFEKCKNRRFDALKSEVDKCVLLCANCHRETHAGLHTIDASMM